MKWNWSHNIGCFAVNIDKGEILLLQILIATVAHHPRFTVGIHLANCHTWFPCVSCFLFVYMQWKMGSFCTKRSFVREWVINVNLSRYVPSRHWGDVECISKRGGWSVPCPGHFRSGKETPIVQEAGWASQDPVMMLSKTSFLASTLPLGYIFLWLMPDITYIHLFLVTEQTDCTSIDLTVLQTSSFP
jgi:hypothetical protein